ncbi:MAG: hypothetical protein JWR69_4697, partial [Pedosphaera sp.]|nr:hypothetical protein [Pedosphaera sp.]
DGLRNSFHEGITEFCIFFASREQISTIQHNDAGGLQRLGGEVPCKRREKPGPTKRLSWSHYFRRDTATTGGAPFQFNPARLNQEKAVGWLAFTEKNIVRFELGLPGMLRKQCEVFRSHGLE